MRSPSRIAGPVTGANSVSGLREGRVYASRRVALPDLPPVESSRSSVAPSRGG